MGSPFSELVAEPGNHDELGPERMSWITLSTNRIEARIAPETGGTVVSLTALTNAGPVPVLRPSDPSRMAPFELASTILAPFSNRISGKGFQFEGAFHDVPPVGPDSTIPIHGDAVSRHWEVEEIRERSLTLSLSGAGTGPFHYSARMTFHVDGARMRQELVLVNDGPRLPYGGGFHPFFPRYPSTTLQFQATGIWLAGEDCIPTALVSIDEIPLWDFREAKCLPPDHLDNGFSGWSGPAMIAQPDLGIRVRVDGSPNLGCAIAYSPRPEQPFFCFEPVMHPVDAFNMPGFPGLEILDTGQQLRIAMDLSWSDLPPA